MNPSKIVETIASQLNADDNVTWVTFTGRSLEVGCLKQKHRASAMARAVFLAEALGFKTEPKRSERSGKSEWTRKQDGSDALLYCAGVHVWTEEEFESRAEEIRVAACDRRRKTVLAALLNLREVESDDSVLFGLNETIDALVALNVKSE